MPIDEFLGDVIVDVAGSALSEVSEFVLQSVFEGRMNRFFHATGRRLIYWFTLGRRHVQPNLRTTLRGTKPNREHSDWLAWWVGFLTWFIAMTATFILLFVI
jgi:hypothetical protein